MLLILNSENNKSKLMMKFIDQIKPKMKCIDMINIESTKINQCIFPGSDLSMRDTLIVKQMKNFINDPMVQGFSIFNYNEKYDFNLSVLSDCNEIKSKSIIHQYDDQCIGFYVTVNQFKDLEKQINDKIYYTKPLYHIVTNDPMYLLNSVNEISFDQMISTLENCTNNQIKTHESVFRRLVDIFNINESVRNFINLFGIESLKQMIKNYMDIYCIESVLSDTTLDQIRLCVRNNNISIRNIISLDHGTKERITKKELIDTLKKYNLDSYYQILNEDIHLHWDIFYPLEGFNYPFCIIVPSRNNPTTFMETLRSIYQSYDNYRVIYIDDQSDNNESLMVKQWIDDNYQNQRTILISQKKRQRQCAGRFIGYHMAYDDEIVMFVDGDDKLCNNAINIVNQRYKKCDVVLTYGGYYDTVRQNTLKGNEKFPDNIIFNNNYRNYKFITTHLRTGFAKLFKSICLNDLLDTNGEFCHIMSDYVEMIPALEMATYKPNTINNKKYFDTINEPLYIYNFDNSNKYLTSYARRNEPNNIYKQYRIHVEAKMKKTNKYTSLIQRHNSVFQDIKLQYKSNINDDFSPYDNHTHVLVCDKKMITKNMVDTLIDLIKKYSFSILTFDPVTDEYVGYNEISNTEYPMMYLTGTIINHHIMNDAKQNVQFKFATTMDHLRTCCIVMIKKSMFHTLAKSSGAELSGA